MGHPVYLPGVEGGEQPGAGEGADPGLGLVEHGQLGVDLVRDEVGHVRVQLAAPRLRHAAQHLIRIINDNYN